MKNSRDKLGEYLKQKRLKANLSQWDVAKKLGYSSAQFISNWERGVANPPINALRKIGELYSISPEDLFEMTLQNVVEEVTVDLRRKFFKTKA